jgi:protein required for attachment to host cells
MSEYCVVVAEGARARFFTLEPAEVPELSGGPDLVEHDALANPQHRAHDDSIYANTRGGRYRTPGGQGHGYDEHRQRHDALQERMFARDIASRLDSLARSNGTRRIILCAEKRMLGVLRGVVSAPPGTEIVEVGKDLAKLPTPELHRHLARDGHIPSRRPRANGG